MNLTPQPEGVNVTFKDPVYKIFERIKNEPYMRWLGKMGKDLARRNQNLYCGSYYRAMLCNERPVRAARKCGAFERICYQTRRRKCRTGVGKLRQYTSPPLRIIEIIHAISVNVSRRRSILSVATLYGAEVID